MHSLSFLTEIVAGCLLPVFVTAARKFSISSPSTTDEPRARDHFLACVLQSGGAMSRVKNMKKTFQLRYL